MRCGRIGLPIVLQCRLVHRLMVLARIMEYRCKRASESKTRQAIEVEAEALMDGKAFRTRDATSSSSAAARATGRRSAGGRRRWHDDLALRRPLRPGGRVGHAPAALPSRAARPPQPLFVGGVAGKAVRIPDPGSVRCGKRTPDCRLAESAVKSALTVAGRGAKRRHGRDIRHQ